MNTTTAPSDRVHQPPKTGPVSVLGTVVVAAVLGCASLQPAQAAECSTDEATRVAVERYGGQALSVIPDGDYLVVRLRLPDGRVIDVAVDRWGCSDGVVE